ncbi:hypothetical protein ISO4_03233 [Alcanivorax venustensis ISO4]|uniref:Uncharacterized protein n=1 Tax=Alloalcanivorax venustensis ISO4 TaxID=1177184 RepID=A0ABS0AKH5_9GAMM|nr:hypothetical protein [Alloalcanivorax venustensis ISO4]
MFQPNARVARTAPHHFTKSMFSIFLLRYLIKLARLSRHAVYCINSSHLLGRLLNVQRNTDKRPFFDRIYTTALKV